MPCCRRCNQKTAARRPLGSLHVRPGAAVNPTPCRCCRPPTLTCGPSRSRSPTPQNRQPTKRGVLRRAFSFKKSTSESVFDPDAAEAAPGEDLVRRREAGLGHGRRCGVAVCGRGGRDPPLHTCARLRTPAHARARPRTLAHARQACDVLPHSAPRPPVSPPGQRPHPGHWHGHRPRLSPRSQRRQGHDCARLAHRVPAGGQPAQGSARAPRPALACPGFHDPVRVPPHVARPLSFLSSTTARRRAT